MLSPYPIVFLNITRATVVRVFVPSEVESEMYTCRAVGSPLPPRFLWNAQETGSNNEVQLMNSIDGVQRLSHEENGEGVGILRLRSDGTFHSPYCAITSTASNGMLDNREFTRMDPITIHDRKMLNNDYAL